MSFVGVLEEMTVTDKKKNLSHSKLWSGSTKMSGAGSGSETLIVTSTDNYRTETGIQQTVI